MIKKNAITTDNYKNLTIEKIIELYKKYQSYPNIINHALCVGFFAKYIAQKIKNNKNNSLLPNIDLTFKGGLMHDIGKTISIKEYDIEKNNTKQTSKNSKKTQ
jgi:putative nucleotidyltransferase with HDIG domain